jgi:hypothetical protein
MAQQLRANAEFIVTGLTPRQQGFWSGLFQAALSGAVSGAANRLARGKDKESPQPRAMGGLILPNEIYQVHKDEIIVPTSPGHVFNPAQMKESAQKKLDSYFQPKETKYFRDTIENELKQVTDRLRDTYRESNIERVIKTITNNVAQDTTSKELVSTIKSIVPVRDIPPIKIALERVTSKPEIHKETGIEKVLRETVKSLTTQRLQPLRVEGRALGGPVFPGNVYEIHNNEYFTPLQPGHVYNQEQMNRSNQKGGTTIVNHFHLPAAEPGSYMPKKSQREYAQMIASILQQNL